MRRGRSQPGRGSQVEVGVRLLVIVSLRAVAAVAALPAAGVDSAPKNYRIVQRYKLGGEGGWDYLTSDPQTQRLYFGRSTRVQVMDENTGKLLGEIPDTPGIHGVALVRELGRAFTSNGRDS